MYYALFTLLIFSTFINFGNTKSERNDTSQSFIYSLIEYPEIKYCFSSMDLLDGSQSSNYLILQRDLGKNCTHVYGNIVINNIKSEINGSQSDFEFLSEIKEITGSLKIRNSNISLIPLRNLRVIRGDSRLYNHDSIDGIQNSLEVSYDQDISEQPIKSIIDLRSLRSIVNGNIYISPLFCSSLGNIDWNELLEDPNRQSVSTKCSPNPKMCSQECSKYGKNGFCWGPSANQCQIFSKCKKRMCANRCFVSQSRDEECCNSQCLGGCTSSTASSCMACQGVLDGNSCQPECPSKKIINRETGIPEDNKSFRPLFVNICLNKCPEGSLEQEGECKSQCTFRKYERKGNQCVPCTESCEQICTPEEIFSELELKYDYLSLDYTKLKKLANCTIFKGSIQIDSESFKGHRSEFIPITNAEDLKFLSNLRNISGSIYIDLKDAQFELESLSFLSNLQAIESHMQFHPYSLGIINTAISYLGLTSLTTIKNKPVLLKNNTKLCYFDVKKFKNTIKQDEIFFINGTADRKWCEQHDQVCSKECDLKFGCWGPGPFQCRVCANMTLGKMCAKDCFAVPGYLPNSDRNSKVCLKCHEECAKTCSGIRSDQCIGGCKHATENSKCVRECSRTYFLNNETKLCEPCHPDCHPRNITRSSVCTGPSNILGKGGCNKCQSIIINKNNEKCFSKPVLDGYFSVNHPNTANFIYSKYIEKYTDLIVTYEPCHELCSKCTMDTNQRISKTKGCTQCKGYWYDDKCVRACPSSKTFLVNDETKSSHGKCYPCHLQCNGCYGADKTQCVECNNFQLLDERNSTQFSCVESCPPSYISDISSGNGIQRRCHYVFLTKLELILVILALVFSLFLLIFIVIITKFFHNRKENRRREKLKAYFSNANESDSQTPSPPNMNHLLVISSDYLEFQMGGDILGKGTFGSVYAGKWKPDNHIFDDSSSMNSCKDRKVDVVIKVLNESCDQNEFMEEVRVMASVRHKHCLRLIGVSFKGNQKLLISSYMPLGSMEKYLERNKKSLTGQILLKWAEQIANGMLYLENNHIIHRDLATRNVLIYKESHVQITDFGLSKFIKPNREEIQIVGGMVPVRWLAIETLREGIYSHKTDVWAYAVTLWEIFTFAKIPYENLKAHEIRDEIIRGTRLNQPEICSLDIYILMLKCWNVGPEERPTFEYLWNEFKNYSNNSESYLSYPNVEEIYKKGSTNNYIEIKKNNDFFGYNDSHLYSNNRCSLNDSMKSRISQKSILVADSNQPLLYFKKIKNKLYEPANYPISPVIPLNGSFNNSNGTTNGHEYHLHPTYSPSSSTTGYLEPSTTRT